MNNSQNLKKNIQLTDIKVPVLIPNPFRTLVNYYCSRITKDEWSGILFYKVDGSIKDISNMKIEVVDILLMDKGSTTLTEFEYDESYVEHLMNNPHLNECKSGLIHSHNFMDTFFSSTDMEELKSNASNYNYYLSLIVNNYGNMCAKIAIAANPSNYIIKDENGNDTPIKVNNVGSNIIFTIDCEIQKEYDAFSVSDEVVKRTDYIIKKSESKISNIHIHKTTYPNQLSLWDNELKEEYVDTDKIEEVFVESILGRSSWINETLEKTVKKYTKNSNLKKEALNKLKANFRKNLISEFRTNDSNILINAISYLEESLIELITVDIDASDFVLELQDIKTKIENNINK